MDRRTDGQAGTGTAGAGAVRMLINLGEATPSLGIQYSRPRWARVAFAGDQQVPLWYEPVATTGFYWYRCQTTD